MARRAARRRSLFFLTWFCVTSLAAACDGGLVDTRPAAWEGAFLADSGPGGLTGSVAAVSDGRTTQASIRIAGADPATSYRWAIQEGDCGDPGERVGGLASYPPLGPGTDGGASSDAVLNSGLRPGTAYHAVVQIGSDPDAITVACARMAARSGG